MADASPRPSLCVLVGAGAEVDEASLVAALRARIATKQVAVKSDCAGQPSTWVLRLERMNPVTVALDLTGPEVAARRTVTIDGMTPEEVVQFISITAAEAVRPSMDKLLAAMGLLEPSGDDLVATLEAKAPPTCKEAICPEPRVELRRVEVPIAPSPSFALEVGPLFGVQEKRVSPFFGLGGALSAGWFFAGADAGLHWVPPSGEEGVRLHVWEIEAGLRAGVTVSIVALGLSAQARLSIARPSGAGGAALPPAVPDGLQFFWNGGFGLFSSVALWTTDVLELRLLARMWVWPQPNRFLVEGEPLLTQSHLELLVGPEIAFGESFSKRRAADQVSD